MRQLIVLIFVFNISAAYAEDALITARDTLASTNQQTFELKAELEKDDLIPFRWDIEGEVLNFFQNDKLLGSALTNEDGKAIIQVSNLDLGSGTWPVRISLNQNSEYQAKDQYLNLTIWPENKKIVIADIDQTVSDSSNLSVILRPIERQPAFPHSVSKLKEFTEKGYGVIFLTAREDALINNTRAWLAYNQFPKGHLKTWDFDILRRLPWNHGDFKDLTLQKIKEVFPNIALGFGDKIHDLEAYDNNGISAYLFRSRHNKETVLPSFAEEFDDWSILTVP